MNWNSTRLPIHPVDLTSEGLCCCLKCRGVCRALDGVEPDRAVRVVAPWHRPALRVRFPELVANVFAGDETTLFDGRHLC